jgi:MscS family membrane protein
MIGVGEEDVVEYSRQFAELLIVLLVTAVALVAAYIVMRRWLWPALRRSRFVPNRRMLSLVEQFVYLSIIVVGLRQAVLLIAPEMPRIPDLFFLLYWALGIYFAIRLTSAGADWYLGTIAPRLEGTAQERVVPIFKYVVYTVIVVLALIVFMDYFGITSSALTASVAALGVTTLVVGLAAENIINDVISGVVIRADHPFRVGDRIEISELSTWGDVQEVGWRSTRILTRDKRMVTVPNSLIGKNLVTNYSVPDKVFRVETDVVVAYGADIESIRGMIRESMEAQDWVMKDRPIQVLLWEFRDSGVLVRARCWIEDYVDTRLVVDQLNTAIYRRLFEAGVIAGPSSDVVLHRADKRVNGRE